MRRAIAAVPLVLLALGGPPARAAEKPLLPAPAIPPALQAIEAKADALQITSERVSLSTSLRLGHLSKVAREFARLLELRIEGVETTSPPAAALTATLFGSHVRLRYVEGHSYLFSWDLGLHDGGRPWIELGHGVVGKLFGGLGTKPQETAASGAERYRKFFTLVNDGRGIHELAPSTLFGQAVTGFEEEIEPKQVSESTGSGGALGGFDAARRPRPVSQPEPRLSIYFAASGAIVRAQVLTGDAATGATVTVDFPAINFPYTIPPPPPSHVISEREALKRFPPQRSTRSGPLAPASETTHGEAVTPGRRSGKSTQ